MNTSVKNTRSLYWDNIKGFLMLLVVFAHILFNFQEGSTAIDSKVTEKAAKSLHVHHN